MAGKASVFASRPLHYALDSLSKNALLDLIVDRVRAEIGEDATDQQIAAHVQEWLGPVSRGRGDKPVNLSARIDNWHALTEKARARMIAGGYAPQAVANRYPEVGVMMAEDLGAPSLTEEGD